MLIGRNDIGNSIITLGTCFSIFVYILARFCFALIGGNLMTGTQARGGLEVEFKFQRCSCKFSLTFLFQPCCQSAWESL